MEIDQISFYASVLPWRTCGPDWFWHAGGQAERTTDAVRSLERVFGNDVVWGGDWNQTMTGPNHGGTRAGRAAIDDLLADRGLLLATRGLPHRTPGLAAIDHIAVPDLWEVTSAERVEVPSRLSDHDVYVVEVESTCAAVDG